MVEAGPSDEARRTAPVRMDFMVMRPGCQSVRRGAIEAGRRVDATMGGHFEGYINLRGERTLRAYSRPLNLARFDRTHPGGMTSEDDLWWIPEHLLGVPHTRLLTAGMTRTLSRVDRRSLDAGLVGYRAH